MKKIIPLLSMIFGLLFANNLLSQNVAINADGSAPNASAMLDIKSTTQGLLIPRMTTVQRTAILAPAVGLTVFDINTRSFHFYNGVKWVEIASATANFWLLNGINAYNNTGYAGLGTNIPASRLHIVGNEASIPLRIQNKLVTGHTGIHFYNSSNALMGQIGFGNISAPALANSFYAGSTGNAPFIFTTGNIERMRIDNAGAISIGTAGVPAASSILDIKSSSKGLLIPRMSLAQRNLIASPAISLMIYQTDNTPGYYFYNGTGWVQLTSGGSTNSWSLNGTHIFKNNPGNVGIGTNTPSSPLSFPNALGNKISFWNAGVNNDFGIGINTGVMQLYTAGTDKIAFGWGNANDFKETVAIHTGSGMLAYPNVLGNKISFWRAGPNNDFGIGINTGVMQLYTAGTDKIAFGWGNANAFNETLAIHTGSGLLAFPNVLGNKIRFWTNGPNSDYGIGVNAGTLLIHTAGHDKIAFGWGSANDFKETMTFYSGSGQLGIGTTNLGSYRLSVNGNIRSKEIVVEGGWADYVFDKNYKLRPLDEVEKFIRENNHLPGIPSAREVEEKGLQVGDTQRKMMEKIEELTLYVIEQNKIIMQLKEEIKEINRK
jgi:hypothetical protein